jgi:tRNA(Arg) A34 adenosine deaminase TadA
MNLNIAKKVAKAKSRHRCHRHAALIMSGKRVLMAGWNHEELHAEMDVLRKMRWYYHDLDSPVGYDLLSIRITRGNKYGFSKPCRSCLGNIIGAGIRRIIYTDRNGETVMEKL